MASSVQAQPRSDEFPPIDAGVRAAIVDSITAVIDSVYVLEEPAKAIVAGLKKNLADGDYDDLTDPGEFADRLYEDSQAINHDGHFRIMAMPPLDQDVAEAGQDEDPADVERRRRMVRAMNYGFRKAEILPGGVGYVRFDQFGASAAHRVHGCDAHPPRLLRVVDHFSDFGKHLIGDLICWESAAFFDSSDAFETGMTSPWVLGFEQWQDEMATALGCDRSSGGAADALVDVMGIHQ